MKILITGICGFVGASLARYLREAFEADVYGIDNLSRPGSELNRDALRSEGFTIFSGDIRMTADLDTLPRPDWVIDAAADPSVLSGLHSGSRHLMDNNLVGTLNLLEFCKGHGSGLILLSTSRVYSIRQMADLPLREENGAFHLSSSQPLPAGVSESGIAEDFSTDPPLSLYGVSKRASELLALEYREAFGFPVWINRCGVIGGAGQFGKADQGIFAFWVHSWFEKRPLKYIGFGGQGYQVRDCLHPQDLARLVEKQIRAGLDRARPPLVNAAGGAANAVSLRQLSELCANRFGPHEVASEKNERPFDIPWCVLDSTLAEKHWNWKPEIDIPAIVAEIGDFAEKHPEWIQVAAGKA